MARRRKGQNVTGFGIKKGRKKQVHSAPSDPKERYGWAIDNGHELNNLLSGRLSGKPTSKNMREFFPNGSVGDFLLSKGTGRLKDIYDYYSRGDIQQAMFKYAARRQITFLRVFKPQYDRLVKSSDILPLSLCTMLMNGKHWPSLHGTVSKYASNGQQMCDAVIEIDFKSSWKKCFEMTRPIVKMLRDSGAVFRLKFSGNCSVHIIIPGELLQIQGYPLDHSRFFRCLTDVVKKRLQEPRYLDTSFHMPHHFLRLAYSVNENTGLVSLPFNASDYDGFDPSQAHPKNVRPLPDWWAIPKNSSKRMEDFIRSVMRGKLALSSRRVVVDVDVVPSDGWQVDQKVVRQARQRKRMAEREFLPNEGFYDRMVRHGQDTIDLREFLLLEDQASKVALRTMKHLHSVGRST